MQYISATIHTYFRITNGIDTDIERDVEQA